MSTPTQPAAPERSENPTILWNKVLEARGVVTRERHLPLSRSASIARAQLLAALEAYAVSLTNHGRPIPYLLRDELRLKRLTRYE
jgi:hypothetical protein